MLSATFSKIWAGPLALTLSGVSLLACSTARDESPASASPAEEPLAEVGVILAQKSSSALLRELPGRVTPTRVAEVRPRVAGIVLERKFEQGSEVKEGDVLFRLESAALRADQASTRAALLRAQAAEKNAKSEAERARTLLENGVLTELERDQRLTTLALATAEVQMARATAERASVLLDYATVRAPISGRIGRALITEGALVGPETATPLALIQQLDPIYVDFTQSATELYHLRNSIRQGALGAAEKDSTPIQLFFSDGTLYPKPGQLLFSDLTVDPSSGRITLRGLFPNPDGDLLTGMYVRVKLEQAKRPDVIVLPSQAIRRDTGSSTPVVFVVDKNDTIEAREVEVTSGATPQEVVIESGLRAGEHIVVDGFQKFGPGSRVRPIAWSPSPSNPAQDG